MWSFDGFTNFTLGFLHGSEIYDMEYFELCRDQIDALWLNETRNMAVDFMDKKIFDGLQNFYDILYNSHEVMGKCYPGMKVITIDIIEDLNETYEDISSAVEFHKQAAQNMFFHFSEIYDNIQALYFFVFQSEYSPGYTPFEAGFLIGEIY